MNHLLLSCRGFVGLVLILAAITLAGCVQQVVSVEQVDKMIKDQVPIGSDKQQVRAFIDNLKVGSLKIGRETEFHQATKRALGNRDPEKVAELGDRIAEFIGAVIFDAKSGFFYHDNIVIQFYMDKDGRMIGYTVTLQGSE
jgi:hypothetical protein